MRVHCRSLLWFTSLVIFTSVLLADEVEYSVSGVDEPLLTNVHNQVSAYRIGRSARINSRIRRKLLEDAKTAAANSVRPYGYFHPVISTEIELKEAGKWQLRVNVVAGPPVLIRELNIDLIGQGKELDTLTDWYSSFPLSEGKVLKQQKWDKAKLDALELLEKTGYLKAKFTQHSIRVDTVANSARLNLTLDTGPQAVMGKVTFNQQILDEGILDSIQRFKSGDAYNSWLLEKFRLDLWRSGYFQDIEVVERRELSSLPPRVDLEVNLTPRNQDTYQGTIGYGTDTQVRLQFLWGRHLLSPRGDSFDVGFGWQQRDNEFTAQANYRLPRKVNSQQFWISSVGIKSEKQTLEASIDNDLENRFNVARGTVNDYSLRLGKTRTRNLQGGLQQFFETIYVQYLNEQSDFSPTGNVDVPTFNLNANDGLFKSSSNSVAVGMEWDWPEIRGRGFQTTGHHERAWVFTSNDAWGSEIDYSQIYLSSRWNFMAGTRWKFLMRAEAAYSDSNVSKATIPTTEGPLEIEVTDLPNLYRFKAGGSRSVRGYAFEILDNNGLGSNHVFTASAEVEYHFHENWSAAAFTDIGNAFNDWNEPKLKLGSGVGIRWYSIIGAVRLDFAKGWDLKSDPWRIHLTIGTPLL